MRSRRRVLLVDDDPVFRQLEAEILVREGCVVSEAASLEEALVTASGATSFDLLMADFWHSELPADELVQRFATLQPQTPRLLVNNSIRSHNDPAREQMWDAVLPRPFTMLQLIELIRTLMSKPAQLSNSGT
ncbi:MAG TPA: response regulator [Verrucomicrobiae bacterium]|nr:response regulator [Verrucomicrobiae bacterium]